jgi:hypothetical protein
LLTEENLSKWPQMATEQRLDVYKAKVDVEIDAQQRLLKQFELNQQDQFVKAFVKEAIAQLPREAATLLNPRHHQRQHLPEPAIFQFCEP